MEHKKHTYILNIKALWYNLGTIYDKLHRRVNTHPPKKDNKKGNYGIQYFQLESIYNGPGNDSFITLSLFSIQTLFISSINDAFVRYSLNLSCYNSPIYVSI